MTAEDIRSADLLSMLMMYEAEIADWYEKFERGEITKGNYSKIRDELVNKQFVLINQFKSDEYWKGFDYACELLDETYAKTHPHEFNIADCLKAKVNRLSKKKIRKNLTAPEPE